MLLANIRFFFLFLFLLLPLLLLSLLLPRLELPLYCCQEQRCFLQDSLSSNNTSFAQALHQTKHSWRCKWISCCTSQQLWQLQS
jgi:hypothetical protein